MRSEEEKKSQELLYQIEDAEEQLKKDIKETGRALTEAKRELEDSYCVSPFNTQHILDAEAQVERLELGLNKAKALLKKLF